MDDVKFKELIKDKPWISIVMGPLLAMGMFRLYRKKQIDAIKILSKAGAVIGRKYHYIDLSKIRIFDSDLSKSISFLLESGAYKDYEFIYSKSQQFKKMKENNGKLKI